MFSNSNLQVLSKPKTTQIQEKMVRKFRELVKSDCVLYFGVVAQGVVTRAILEYFEVRKIDQQSY